MHPVLKARDLAQLVINAAHEVHREKGPGLSESIYHWCLSRELGLRQVSAVRQKPVTVTYKGFVREESLRFHLLVEDLVLVRIKATEILPPVERERVYSQMKLLNAQHGLLLNFNVPKLADGISHLVLPDGTK